MNNSYVVNVINDDIYGASEDDVVRDGRISEGSSAPLGQVEGQVKRSCWLGRSIRPNDELSG